MTKLSGFQYGTAARLFCAALAFAASACASTPTPPARDVSSMMTEPGRTRVFVFADWDSFAARPMTTNTHRVAINSNFVGTFDDGEFLELDVPAGQYAIEVYDYGWFGKLEDHETWNFNFGGTGKPSFLALTDHSDAMSLTSVDADYGFRAVNARQKAEMSAAASSIGSLPAIPPAGI